MADKIIFTLAFLVILVQGMTKEEQLHQSDPNPSSAVLHPLQNVIIYENRENKSGFAKVSIEDHSRVKRQYRDRYYPLPIIVSGGGFPVSGPRGYGGRGYGGRGVGGRGFGGRGIGGRGFGGRGIGGRGIGGRGGIGGGRGGRG